MIQPSNLTTLLFGLVTAATGSGIAILWPSERWLGVILLVLGLPALIVTGISYWRDCHSPLNLVGIPSPPLSRSERERLLLCGNELLCLADEGNRHLGEVFITEVLPRTEKAWIRDIGEWLKTRPYLKDEILGKVFIPIGTSSYDAFKLRVAARITKIRSIPATSWIQ